MEGVGGSGGSLAGRMESEDAWALVEAKAWLPFLMRTFDEACMPPHIPLMFTGDGLGRKAKTQSSAGYTQTF